jgi:hypothetical protein
VKKHTKQITSGIILFILGGIVIPTIFCIIAFTYFLSHKPLARFAIPGQTIVNIEESGRYYLWNDVHTTFNGKSYHATGEFPESLEISLLDNQDGDPVVFVSDTSMTFSDGNSYKISIGYFEVQEPATYILSVLGGTEEFVCSFGTSIFTLKNILIFLGTFGVTMLTGIIGFILIIIGIINLIKVKKHRSLDAGSSPA